MWRTVLTNGDNGSFVRKNGVQHRFLVNNTDSQGIFQWARLYLVRRNDSWYQRAMVSTNCPKRQGFTVSPALRVIASEQNLVASTCCQQGPRPIFADAYQCIIKVENMARHGRNTSFQVRFRMVHSSRKAGVSGSTDFLGKGIGTDK